MLRPRNSPDLGTAAARSVVDLSPTPQELRDDVVRVARQREDGVTLKQVAKDFGISESCLTNWMSQADRGRDPLRPTP